MVVYTYVTNAAAQALSVGDSFTDTFSYTIKDSDGDFSTVNVTMTVTGINDLPVAVSDNITPIEDTPISVPLVGTDVDGIITAFTITGGPMPTQGTLTYDDDGVPGTPNIVVPLNTVLTPVQAATVMFTPALNYTGSVDPITYTVTDNDSGVSTSATVTIADPVAVDDVVTITGLTDGTVASTDAQVTEADLAAGTNPTGTGESTTGTFNIGPAGSLISLTINGGATISLQNLIDATVAAPITITSTSLGSLNTLNITDYNTTTGEVTYSYAITGAVDHTAGDVNDYFVIATTDAEGDVVSGTLAINIADDAPIARDDARNIFEGTSPIAGNVFGTPNATGDVADSIGADTNSTPATDVGTGTTLNGQIGTFLVGTHGSLILDNQGTYNQYILDNASLAVNGLGQGESLTEIFTYQITDGDGDTATATLTITINGVDDPVQVVDPTDPSTDPTNPAYDPTNPTVIADPNNLIPDVAYDDNDTTVAIPAGDYFGDAENDTLTFAVADLPPGLMFNTTTGEISGTLDNSASQGGNGGTGIYNVTITATDPQNNTASTMVTYTISNPAPVAIDDVAMGGDEDNDQTGNVISDATTGDADAAPDTDAILVTDVNGTTITTGNPAVLSLTYGTLTLAEDGAWVFEPNSVANQLTAGDLVQEMVTYTITDDDGAMDTATLTIDINGVNDPVQVVDPTDPSTDPTNPAYDPTNPTVIADPNNLIPDVAYDDNDTTVAIPAGDYFGDAENDTLTFAVADLPPGLMFNTTTGEISGTLDNSASQGGNGGTGIYNVTITATDPQNNTASTMVTYTISNPAPVAIDDVAMGGDEDNDQTGNVISDATTGDADAAPDTDAILVTDVNGTTITTGNPAVLSLTYGTLTLAEDGAWVFEPNSVANQLTAGDLVQEMVTYTITDDDGAMDTATLTIDINGVNDPVQVVDPTDPSTDPTNPAYDPTNPTVIADPNNLIPDVAYDDNDTTVAIPAGDYFGDAENDTLTFAVADLPPGLMFNTTTGEISGTLDNSASQGGNGGTGIYNVTITATDPQNNTASTMVTYTISNPAPVAVDDMFAVTEDIQTTGNVITDPLTGDSDTDGDGFLVTSATVDINGNGSQDVLVLGTPTLISDNAGNPIGTVMLNEMGDVTFDSALNYNGPVPVINYTVTDDDGASDNATLTLGPVSAVNDDPIANPDPVVVQKNTFISGDIIDNDTDVDNVRDDLVVSSVMVDINGDGIDQTLPLNTETVLTTLAGDPIGTLQVDVDGSFAFTPALNYSGAVPVVTYVIDDGAMGTASSTLDISILDNPPEVTDDVLTAEVDTPISGNILTNDNGGDPLDMVIVGDGAGNSIAVPTTFMTDAGGTIVINPDGSYLYTPPAEYFGSDTITIEVCDTGGNCAPNVLNIEVVSGGTDVQGLLNKSVKESDEVDPTFGGRYVSANGEFPSSKYPREEAVGIILEAVSNINSLGSLADIDTFAPILSAVNGIESLDGIALNATNGVENIDGINKQHFDEVNHNIMDFDAEILDGVAQNITKQINFDSFLKEGRVFLHADNIKNNEGGVRDFTAIMGDGRALPNWITSDYNGLFIIDPPVGVEEVTLKIIGLRDDGNSTTHALHIDILTGVMKDLREKTRNFNGFSNAVDATLQANQAGKSELQRILNSGGADHG